MKKKKQFDITLIVVVLSKLHLSNKLLKYLVFFRDFFFFLLEILNIFMSKQMNSVLKVATLLRKYNFPVLRKSGS